MFRRMAFCATVSPLYVTAGKLTHVLAMSECVVRVFVFRGVQNHGRKHSHSSRQLRWVLQEGSVVLLRKPVITA